MGAFAFRGVSPGRYIVVSWYDAPPADVYDPAAIEKIRAAGVALSVAEDDAPYAQLRLWNLE